MPVLPTGDRENLWGELMRIASARREGLPLVKADLLAAVHAVDDWINSNAASFNAAVPLPARTALTGRQKAEILMLVI